MKKALIIILLVACLLGLMTACNKSNGYLAPQENRSEADYDSAEIDSQVPNQETTPLRKIIYEASVSIYTENLGETIAAIKAAKAEDEWFDSESISGNYARLVIRVKTDRLDAFLDGLSNSGTIDNIEKTATDISINYQDTSNRIDALTAERARLVELYEQATIGDIIEIEKRLSQIDLEIGNLQGTLNQYDSLVDYSRVTITVYQDAPKADMPFGKRISNVFKGAWKALGTFLKWLVIAAVAVFPFAVVFVPIGVGILLLLYFIKKKKKSKIVAKIATKDATEDSTEAK